jgi:phage replication O-like protein O
MPITSPNFTQYPNEVLDQWMSKLSGSEFKVLSKIIRQTFGWGKEWDGIAISQLCDSTGLSNRHVIKAINVLIKHDLITTAKAEGKTTRFMVKVEPVTKGHTTHDQRSQVKPETCDQRSHTKEINKETKQKKRVLPSSLQEVQDFIRINNLKNVDGKFFWEFFTDGNWIDSNGKPVMNYKQKLRTWNRFPPRRENKSYQDEKKELYGADHRI